MKELIQLLIKSYEDTFRHYGISVPVISEDSIKEKLAKYTHTNIIIDLLQYALPPSKRANVLLTCDLVYAHYLCKNKGILEDAELEAIKVRTYLHYQSNNDIFRTREELEMWRECLSATERRKRTFLNLFTLLFKTTEFYHEYRNIASSVRIRTITDMELVRGGKNAILYHRGVLREMLFDEYKITGTPALSNILDFFNKERTLRNVGWNWMHLLDSRVLSTLFHRVYITENETPEQYIAERPEFYGLSLCKAEQMLKNVKRKKRLGL